MAKYKKGQKLMCIPCGREVEVDSCGMSSTSIWCCGKPMKEKGSRQPARKTAKSRTSRKLK